MRRYMVSSLCLILIFGTGCASFSTTRNNFKKINDALPEVKIEPQEKREPVLIDPNNPGLVPLETITGRRIETRVDSTNRWYPKLVRWAKLYETIALAEWDQRNFALSKLFSDISLMWAIRSTKIRKLSEDDALNTIASWIEKLELPDMPDRPRYFTGEEAYVEIERMKNLFDASRTNRMCLLESDIPWMDSWAYLEWAMELLRQKHYVVALAKARSSFGYGEKLGSSEICSEEIDENFDVETTKEPN